MGDIEKEKIYNSSCKNEYVRTATGYTRLVKKQSKDVGWELNMPTLLETISNYRTNWSNCLNKMSSEYLSVKVFEYNPHGRKDWGRMNKRWEPVRAE